MKTLDIMAIPLTRGLYALVDGEDYEELSKHKWCAVKHGKNYYAVRGKTIGNKKLKSIYMHQQILNTKKGDEIDHHNRCGLDNRKNNIRFCTRAQNNQNRTPSKNKSSKYKGVHWSKQHKKWRPRIYINKKQICFGLFDCEIEAAKMYDIKAKELFKEFANTNF